MLFNTLSEKPFGTIEPGNQKLWSAGLNDRSLGIKVSAHRERVLLPHQILWPKQFHRREYYLNIIREFR